MADIRYLSSEDSQDTVQFLAARNSQEAFAVPEIEEMQMSVRVDNTGAERLYVAHGFVEKNVIYAYEKEIL